MAAQKNATPLGYPFLELDTIDSTNNFALAKVHAGQAAYGTVFFAHQQTQGKGQRGRQWSSTKGQNILMSALVESPFESIRQQFLLGMAVSVACHRFLSLHIPGDLAIKWPNDLYWKESKIGGILIENIVQGQRWVSCVIGVGININQTDFEGQLRNPVSLKQITGKDADPVALAKELCRHLDKAIEELRAGRDHDIRMEYNSHLYKRNCLVELKRGTESFLTTIREITPEGYLVCSGPNEGTYSYGEVEWVI